MGMSGVPRMAEAALGQGGVGGAAGRKKHGMHATLDFGECEY